MPWKWLFGRFPGSGCTIWWEIDLPPAFLNHLYRHGCHLEPNLSHYFSPNTHLLGEAVALHSLGLMFGEKSWERTGGEVVEQQMQRQVRDDGSHFEQSSYYQLYAVDMFVFHALLRSDRPAWYRDRLARMAQYLYALVGKSRNLSFIGDDDGGRFFHPYGQHAEYACATLATCGALGLVNLPIEPEDLYPQAAWWLGIPALDRPPADTAQELPSASLPMRASR